jgi:hypothetical protein
MTIERSRSAASLKVRFRRIGLPTGLQFFGLSGGQFFSGFYLRVSSKPEREVTRGSFRKLESSLGSLVEVFLRLVKSNLKKKIKPWVLSFVHFFNTKLGFRRKFPDYTKLVSTEIFREILPFSMGKNFLRK